MTKLIVLAALLAFPVFLPQDHEGQPVSCNNAYDNAHKCECERAQEKCDPDSQYAGSKCQTYCRPEACKCANPCNS